jgi:hypothetical protein
LARTDREQGNSLSRSTSSIAPVTDSEDPSCTPVIVCRRSISLSEKSNAASDKIGADKWAGHDGALHDSPSSSTSSKDLVNDATEPSCTPQINWRRNISISAKIEPTSDEVVREESPGHDDELDDSSSLSTSSKDPVNDLENTICTPLISWRSNISISANIEPTSDEVVRHESAGHDDELDDSSSLSTPPKDPVNDLEKTVCTPLISWRRNISITANIEFTSDEVVREESAHNDSQLDDSSSLSTSPKDPVNDLEKTVCTPLISWRRNISISSKIEPTSDETIDDSSSLSESSKDPANGSAASSCTQVIMWRRHASCSMKRNSISDE